MNQEISEWLEAFKRSRSYQSAVNYGAAISVSNFTSHCPFSVDGRNIRKFVQKHYHQLTQELGCQDIEIEKGYYRPAIRGERAYRAQTAIKLIF